MRCLGLAIIVFFTALAGIVAPGRFARAEDAPEIVIAVDAANPPLMYGVDGDAKGIYPALLAEAFQRMQQSARIVPVPWRRGLAMLEEGEAGLGGAYLTEERSHRYLASIPIHVEHLRLYVRAKSGASRPQGTELYRRLAGKRVGVILGWSYGDTFDQAVRQGLFYADPSASDLQNFKKLMAGRLDVVIAVAESAAALLSDPEIRSEIEVWPEKLASNPVHLLLPRTKENKALIERFNAAFTSMVEDHTASEITRAVTLSPQNRPSFQ